MLFDGLFEQGGVGTVPTGSIPTGTVPTGSIPTVTFLYPCT